MFTQLLTLAFLAVIALVTAADMPTVSAVGSKFFFSNGTQYFIKGQLLPIPPSHSSYTSANIRPGVAYQLTDDDPLMNGDQCKLDASLMADLGANTIRVYHVDATANHDDCMTAFANEGIYLFLDLDTFDTQFNQVRWLYQWWNGWVLLIRNGVQDTPEWNQTQLSRFTAVLDAFQGYDNLAGGLYHACSQVA